MKVNKAGFIYTIEHLDKDGKIKSVERVKNLMPTIALGYMLKAALLGDTQYTSWYLGLFNNDYTPVASDTLASLLASCGENIDYTGTERQNITFPSVTGSSVSTIANPNVFEFTTTETIRGAFIATGQAWGGTTGLLLSTVKFPSPKYISAGESLRVPVGFSMVSA